MFGSPPTNVTDRQTVPGVTDITPQLGPPVHCAKTPLVPTAQTLFDDVPKTDKKMQFVPQLMLVKSLPRKLVDVMLVKWRIYG